MAYSSKKRKPDPTQTSLESFFDKESKENAPPNNSNENDKDDVPPSKENTPTLQSNKRRMYQCDYCRDAIFENKDDAIRHEETCEARKPSAIKATLKNDESEKKPAKKRRKRIKIPDPQGGLVVNIPFNDGTEMFMIEGVRTDIFGDESITLTGDYNSHPKQKRAIQNYLSGFGKFVW